MVKNALQSGPAGRAVPLRCTFPAVAALLPLLALMACARAGVSPETEPLIDPISTGGSGASETLPIADASTVAGEWDVVSFEGYKPSRVSGTQRAAYADFVERGVSLRIECNYSGRAGKVSDGRFLAGDNSAAGQTAMSCGPEADSRESRYFSFFEKSPSVEHVAPGRLRLRVGTTELVLARPEVHRLNFVPSSRDIEGKWRMTELTAYLPGGGYTGGGLSEVPGRIIFSGDRVFYNRCPQFAASFRLDEEGRLKKTGGALPSSGELGCRELSAPPAAAEQPRLSDILRVLHEDPAVERVDIDSLLLSTDRLGLLITKAPCERLEQSNDHRRSWVSDCASAE